jgi:3-deoxy-D-manno-octulosonic-acid transferase
MAKPMHILYSAALGLVVLLTSPWWLWKMLRAGKYRAGLAERLGRVPARLDGANGAVWVHAVSVGEVLAMTTVVTRLRAAGRRVVVSTTTATGQKLARERFGAENVFYFPLDFAFAVRPYLRTLRPSLLVLAEAEFWPNVLRLAKRSGAKVAVVNARVSDRSFPRYRRFRGLFAGVLRNIDVFLAQSEQDAQRLMAMGADASRVKVAGNLKFDVKPPGEVPLVAQLRDALARGGTSHVIVAGSTLAGEEEVLLNAFGAVLQQHPKAAMVLAPRHPERFAAVADLLAARGVGWQRRSEWQPGMMPAQVFLLDTIGELAAVYQLATLAFVGGSLVPTGGHNIVEPARFGVSVVVGPHNENFREIVDIFERAGAVVIADAPGLSDCWLKLLHDDARRAALGAKSAEVVRQNTGATVRTVEALEALLTRLPSASAGETPTPDLVKSIDPTHVSPGARS